MAAFSTKLQRARDAAGGARSTPALAGAFRLEQVGFKKKLLAMEYTKTPERFPLETVKDRDRRRIVDARLEKMRQREEDERGLVAMEMKRQARMREIEGTQKREATKRVEDAKRQEMVKKWKAEQAAYAKQDAERAEIARKADHEKARIQEEAAEADRLQRIPVLCSTCKGGGMCQECQGSGVHSATFLAPSVVSHPLQFGTKTRGCTACMGCNQGIRGELRGGSGVCTTCSGVGKFCTGFCDRAASAHQRHRARLSQKDEVPPDDSVEECKYCGGSKRPTLEDARALWDSLPDWEPEQRAGS